MRSTGAPCRVLIVVANARQTSAQHLLAGDLGVVEVTAGPALLRQCRPAVDLLTRVSPPRPDCFCPFDPSVSSNSPRGR